MKLFHILKMEPVKILESTLSLIDVVKIALFQILSKLASQLKSVKKVSESFEITQSH